MPMKTILMTLFMTYEFNDTVYALWISEQITCMFTYYSDNLNHLVEAELELRIRWESGCQKSNYHDLI